MQDQIRSMIPPSSSYLGTSLAPSAKQEESKLLQRPVHADPIRESVREDVEEEVEKRVKERVEIERGQERANIS